MHMEDIIQKYQGHIVDPKTQQQLNKPMHDDTGFNEGHEDFLKMLIEKLGSNEINPHNAQTLYNKDVYEKLSDEEKESADMTAMNIMAAIIMAITACRRILSGLISAFIITLAA